MTGRERIKTALRFEKPDRIPINDSIWESTLARWHKEGMPTDADPAEYFGFDISHMFLNCSPEYEQKILEEDDQTRTFTDRQGFKAKIYKHSPTIHFMEHFTKDKKAWEAAKAGYKLDPAPEAPARIDTENYIMHFNNYPAWTEAKNKYRKLYDTGRYMLFVNYGPWEANWRHRGFTELLMDLALDPDWVSEMAAARFECTKNVIDHALSLGMKPDGYFMVEDLGENRGMLFSPETWRRIYKPIYKELGKFLKKRDIDFWMHCCGNMLDVLDDLVECGIQVMQPLQVNAGMDVLSLRAKYGKQLVFYGNISAAAMEGPMEKLDAELKRKIPLWKDGGYIYHSDHSVPSDVSFERYRWIVNRVLEYGS
jgi:uroporphyrinogen decarboxylase